VEELSGAALGVNPFDVAGTADTLHRALSMDPAERRSRAALLRSLVLGRTAADWLDDQLAAAARHSPADRGERQLLQQHHRARRALDHQVGPGRHPLIALSVDHGHPGHRHPPGRQLCAASKAGRSPRSSPNTATARIPSTSDRTTVPLSTSIGGLSSSDIRPG